VQIERNYFTGQLAQYIVISVSGAALMAFPMLIICFILAFRRPESAETAPLQPAELGKLLDGRTNPQIKLFHLASQRKVSLESEIPDGASLRPLNCVDEIDPIESSLMSGIRMATSEGAPLTGIDLNRALYSSEIDGIAIEIRIEQGYLRKCHLCWFIPFLIVPLFALFEFTSASRSFLKLLIFNLGLLFIEMIVLIVLGSSEDQYALALDRFSCGGLQWLPPWRASPSDSIGSGQSRGIRHR
jgi:hypothetical protein